MLVWSQVKQDLAKSGNNLELKGSTQKNKKRALKTVKGNFVWQVAVVDTKLPIFKEHFWHFQVKIKFRKKIMRQGSVRLPETDFFWIIPCKL